MSGCICDFPDRCDGSGILDCEGCGGDFCVCLACHGQGQVECGGCPACEDDDEDPDDDEF